MKLVLASGSERRKELFSWLGIAFEVVVSGFDEKSVKEENPEELVKRLAREKAGVVASSFVSTTSDRRLIQPFSESETTEDDKRNLSSLSRLSKSVERNQMIVVGADTVVVIDKEIIGKPRDEQDALRILTKLSGKTHAVFTGVCVINTETGQELAEVEETEVAFKKLSEKEIKEYVKTGEPLDKGGAYAIQMGARGFVTQVKGSYTNVVGLPLLLLTALLQKQGLTVKSEVEKIIFENTGYQS